MLTAGSLANDDTLGTASLSSDATATSSVGAYSLTPRALTFAAGDADNYAISYVDGTLTVTPASLTIRANNDAKMYDGQPYSGGNGVTYSGFVNGEDASVLKGTLVYGGSAQGAVEVGGYTITASGLSADNYVVSYVDGELTIVPAQANRERDYNLPASPMFAEIDAAEVAEAPELIQESTVHGTCDYRLIDGGSIQSGDC
jgi:hypothetical protein